MKKYILGTIEFFRIFSKIIKNYIRFLKDEPNRIYLINVDIAPNGYHTIVKEFKNSNYDCIGFQFIYQGKEIGNIVAFGFDFIKELNLNNVAKS